MVSVTVKEVKTVTFTIEMDVLDAKNLRRLLNFSGAIPKTKYDSQEEYDEVERTSASIHRRLAAVLDED